MFDFRRPAVALMAAASMAGLIGALPAEAQTIKVVMHSDVKILDPIWTTAYIQRNFGYMVWDTLFALDDGGLRLEFRDGAGRSLYRTRLPQTAA